MVICEKVIDEYLSFLSSKFTCKTEGSYTVLITPFLYSDGDNIELYFESHGDQIRISDMGETSRRLSIYNFNWNKKSVRPIYSKILNSTGVSSSHGILFTYYRPGENLISEEINQLIQAIQETDSLVFTVTGFAPRTFRDEVETFLIKSGFEPTLNYQVEGYSGKVWRIHFFMNHNRNILTKAISATSKGSATNQVNAAYASYDDIHQKHPHLIRTLIIDDNVEVWDEEIKNLARSKLDLELGLWSKKEAFRDALQSINR